MRIFLLYLYNRDESGVDCTSDSIGNVYRISIGGSDIFRVDLANDLLETAFTHHS